MSRQPRKRPANRETPEGGSRKITKPKPAEAEQASLAQQRTP